MNIEQATGLVRDAANNVVKFGSLLIEKSAELPGDQAMILGILVGVAFYHLAVSYSSKFVIACVGILVLSSGVDLPSIISKIK